MIRFFFIRLVVPLLLLFLVRSVLRAIFQSFRATMQQPAKTAERQAPVVPAGGELKKDPVCGTYVSTATSVSRNVNGSVVYFCSKECRDRYKVA
jgi:YHS domain-containing protein